MNTMLDERVDELLEYVEEKCLWQFFSRAWDRQENIDGVLDQTANLLAGHAPRLATPMERLFYADAKIMVDDLHSRFPWISESGEAEIRQLLDGLKGRLVENVITKSTNRELNQHLY